MHRVNATAMRTVVAFLTCLVSIVTKMVYVHSFWNRTNKDGISKTMRCYGITIKNLKPPILSCIERATPDPTS